MHSKELFCLTLSSFNAFLVNKKDQILIYLLIYKKYSILIKYDLFLYKNLPFYKHTE